MDLIPAINITSSALKAEKVRMEVVAENIANAQTTRDVNGQPYQRKVVSFQSVLEASGKGSGVTVSRFSKDSTPGESIYNPSHPHAGPDGMVRMPNVKVAMEMIDLMNASRAYEANLAVVRNAKQIALQAINIGK